MSSKRYLKQVSCSLLLMAGLLIAPGSVLAAPGQDLIPAGLDGSAVSTDGQSLTVSGVLGVELLNLGDDAVVNGFSVLAFEDRNGNASFDNGVDAVLGNQTHSTGLAAGARVNLSIAVSGTVSFKDNIIYVLVDSEDAIAESDETNNLRHTGQSSQFIPPVGMFNPVVEWSWTSSTVQPDALNVMMTPSIIDLNNDQVPDVVFGSTPSTGGGAVEVGFLRALNGADGSELFTVIDPNLQVNTASSIAVGDIDLDGQPEIVACDASGARLIVFEHDGSFKWRSPALEAINWGAPSIADMDGDGAPEIIVGRQVLDNAGTVLWTGAAGRGAPAGTGPLSLVADIDLNGSPDLVAGNTVYQADGTILWQAPLTDGYNAVANFDADSFPEIVLVTGGTVRLLDQDGSVIWGPIALPGGGVGGAPTIADYDSDGEPEIGVAGASRYAVFETDGTLKWSAVTQDRSSNRTGSSVFDFDGDGSAEVVYRDELFLRVYRGSDGGVLFQTPMSSCTWYEYVLVADVDADGNAEIVAVANNNCGFGPQRGVFVFGDANDNWVATRQIWNQHTYHITNINADGSIPAVEPNNWQIAGLNNYRLNEFLPDEGASTDAPDLIPSFIRQDQTHCPVSVDITARVGNGGALAAPSGTSVSIYLGDPSAGGVLLGVVPTTRSLAPGEYEDITVTWNGPTPGLQDIFVVADDDGTGAGAVNEGNEDNNVHQTTLAICSVLQPTVTNVACRAKDTKIGVSWDVLDTALSYRVFRHTNSGSELAGEVDPAVFIDFDLTHGTTYTYTVRGVLANGEETADSAPCSDTPLPRSRDRNRAPQISSTPGLSATQDQPYSYDVEATDPEGAVLTYSLALAPAGATIDSATGLIQWTPDNAAVGNLLLTVVVKDPGGKAASQSWQLSVADVNDPPSMISTPVTSATAGVLYSYDVEAIDPEGDPLTFALDAAPAGMVIDTATGLINWTPAMAQVGLQGVIVRVGDGKGGFATQSYSVTVSLPANTPPSITSIAVTNATEGQLYNYDVDATDADGDTLSYSLVTAPAGMTIDGTSGLIAWTPTAAQIGSHPVSVQADDGNGGTATQNYTVIVDPAPNAAPAITSTPVTTATEGVAYSYDVDATDADGDALSYSLVTAPAGMTIDGTSGLIAWTPTAAQ
ncbi:MAG: VCBS repeat-containing protein, partial [Candidatus Thiodiazotropha sp. (ex Dulcina madagascariensis)]|nr:VCBS repeat-containing protein [Candidatus Thiodiazotropha sp. (ex Dulcina madagascariensis)]